MFMSVTIFEKYQNVTLLELFRDVHGLRQCLIVGLGRLKMVLADQSCARMGRPLCVAGMPRHEQGLRAALFVWARARHNVSGILRGFGILLLSIASCAANLIMS
jgi:hypothetical protein